MKKIVYLVYMSFLILCLSSCNSKKRDIKFLQGAIERYYGFTLPSDFTLTYYYSRSGGFGDGAPTTYACFDYNSSIDDFLIENGFVFEKSSDFESRFTERMENHIKVCNPQIPDSCLVDFNYEYCYIYQKNVFHILFIIMKKIF